MNTYDVTYGYITPGCCFDCVERVKEENKEEAEKNDMYSNSAS